MGQSLQVLINIGKQVIFSKPFCRLISGRIIIKGETRAVVQDRQIRSAIIALLTVLIITLIITTVVPSANLLRLFASFNTNLEQFTLWYQM
jgi:hypothetical protein